MAGLRPTVVVSDVDEDALLDELAGAPSDEIVTRLAEAKADAVVAAVVADGRAVDTVVLTCDSMLLINGELAGKPHTPDVAVERWKAMRGSTGHLLTGHCVRKIVEGETVASTSRCESTAIHFSDAPDEVIERYAATGEPLEVAGAFTLDGYGGWLIDGIDGDPSSVLGISLPLVRKLLAEININVTDLWIAPTPSS